MGILPEMNMMKRNSKEDGFVLVAALLVMLVLTILGIAATTNTSLELQISGNDKVHKRTFYGAEGGAILGSELVEQNLNCPTGFSAGAVAASATSYAADTLIEGAIGIGASGAGENKLAFWTNTSAMALLSLTNVIDGTNVPEDNADFFYGMNPTDAEHTFIYTGGDTNMQAGGSLQMAAGYERKGKSAAGGGVVMRYDIYAQHFGLVNSESIILLGWQHLVGDESSCNY